MPADILRGKYEILKEIGKGGMSRVFLCMDIHLNKQWALKMIAKGEDRKSVLFCKNAMKEAYLMKNLDHPALPRIVDIFEDEKNIYVVMDYVDGITLSRLLEMEGKIPEKKVIEWGRKLTDVLIYLHSRTPAIIHRDLKPANIMLTNEGNIKLIDFGIAREYKDENVKDTSYLGTKGYAAPEQFKGTGQTDARTDIYSLGVTLYALITGKNPTKPPYKIYPVRHWDPGLSRGIESIIKKCTREDPAFRYKDAKSLRYAMYHIKEEDPAYIRFLRKRLRRFLCFGLMAVLGIIMTVSGQMMKAAAIAGDYEHNVRLADTQREYQKKLFYYLKAVDINPKKESAYLGLIESIKEDLSFCVREEEILIPILNKNTEILKGQSFYGRLCYNVGKLYWYYYDYTGKKDDFNIAGMRSSISWFKEALQYLPKEEKESNSAKIYMGIGIFNRDIILNIEEAEDGGLYKDYFRELIELGEYSINESNEIIRINAASLMITALELYSGKFIRDGIKENEIEGLINTAEKILIKTDPSIEKNIALRNKLIERLKKIKKEDRVNEHI